MPGLLTQMFSVLAEGSSWMLNFCNNKNNIKVVLSEGDFNQAQSVHSLTLLRS